MVRVTVWNEYRQERSDPAVRECTPTGSTPRSPMGSERPASTSGSQPWTNPSTASATVLAATDVLTWWGHAAHDQVDDVVVERVQRRVLEGMGLIVLHSGHHSKIFRRLMGTTCNLIWREAAERERIWVVDPSHPIAEGLGASFLIEHDEMYGEYFDIPAPDRLVLVGWFQGGEVFRSGCCFERGRGRIFYFQPGHETYPTYFHADVRRVIANAAGWAAQPAGDPPTFGNRQPVEPF